MKNRKRQRENKRLEKKVVCPHHRCAGNKEGYCRALRTSNFGDKMCPFFKTTGRNEKEKKSAMVRLITLERHDLIDKYHSGKKGGVDDVELLVHPVQNYLAVRPSKKGARNAVQWAKLTDDGLYVPRYIAGAAFLSTIYSLFEWDSTFKYRICGVRKKQGAQIDDKRERGILYENLAQIFTNEKAPRGARFVQRSMVNTNGSLLGIQRRLYGKQSSDPDTDRHC